MRFGFAFVAVASFSACDPPTVTFDVPIEAEAEFQGGGLLGDILEVFGFEEFANVDLESTQEFEQNDVRREQVKNARLTVLNLEILAPQGANFDWLDSLSFSVAAEGEEDALVASKEVGDGLTAFACDLEDVDVAAFVRAPKMAITTEADARNPPDDTTVKVDLTFSITAEVF